MSATPLSYDLAIELATQERYDDALAILDGLARQHPEVVDYDALRARLWFDKGEPERSFAILDAALSRLPQTPLHPAHRWASRGLLAHRYGLLLMSAGRLQEALPWLEEAARRNGLATGEWSAQFHAGLVHYRLGNPARAARYWYDLLYRAPDLGAHDILALTGSHIQASETAGQAVDPLLRLCLARIALDNPDLLQLSGSQGDALAAQQAELVLAAEPDHPEARRVRAPLRYRAGDVAGARDDLAVYLRRVPDPRAQVRELEWRLRAGESAPWQGFRLNENAPDAHGYYLAGLSLAEFAEREPASAAALEPQIQKAWRIALGRFEAYFESGEGTCDDADPHIYSLLCDRLARRLQGTGKDEREERVALHEKGIAVSDFIGHWIDLLDCHDSAGRHPLVVEVAGEVLNRYPLDRQPAEVAWVFSRLIHAWKAIGGTDAVTAARAAIAHMDAQLDALPVEERSEAAHPMAHARAHFAALLGAAAPAMEARERALALDEIEALQERALQIEDAALYYAFGRIWRELRDNGRALPLFEKAIELAAGDAEDQAAPRFQRGLIRLEWLEAQRGATPAAAASSSPDAEPPQQGDGSGDRAPLALSVTFADALSDLEAAIVAGSQDEPQIRLHAAQAALGMQRREAARAHFLRARELGAKTGRQASLYRRVEDALKRTRPTWKFWGV
ncbi:tetratricopeptide repeat protein [Cupriavidus sp. AU9028]|uniref:tetratricopeptide repeat protein n=1 Tax=Cupriavidus sp. AU9028 TaxID=2871157 RepID=UPI001C95967D|nr:tetratricopeptide repeat protein [Cupriavidus sp. AU9028]